METSEKIVEAYVRYVKGWATIPNIKCKGQFEIDLLAVDPVKRKRYHIEAGVSISGSYSKLTTRRYSEKRRKTRGGMAGARRTLDYFMKRKFDRAEVLARLAGYGFTPGRYTRVIVSWGASDEALRKVADEYRNLEIWDFRDIVRKLAALAASTKTYYVDDSMRTLQLYDRARKTPCIRSHES